jgi:hypothetical protein
MVLFIGGEGEQYETAEDDGGHHDEDEGIGIEEGGALNEEEVEDQESFQERCHADENGAGETVQAEHVGIEEEVEGGGEQQIVIVDEVIAGPAKGFVIIGDAFGGYDEAKKGNKKAKVLPFYSLIAIECGEECGYLRPLIGVDGHEWGLGLEAAEFVDAEILKHLLPILCVKRHNKNDDAIEFSGPV